MIEDAIEEAEQLSKHLKDGLDFYKIVVPKLAHLKQEVGDASIRLTIERCEFEESDRRGHQESSDARFAATITQQVAGTESMSARGLQVDDLKVAHLVAMGFDTEKVVAALKKHNNDLDQSLNELLC
jgi:hypothetical protein